MHAHFCNMCVIDMNTVTFFHLHLYFCLYKKYQNSQYQPIMNFTCKRNLNVNDNSIRCFNHNFIIPRNFKCWFLLEF